MQSKLARVPEWAIEIEPDRVLLACWFNDVELRWHASWPQVVECICPMTITAERIMSDYKSQVYKSASRLFGDKFQILFRPQSAKTRSEVEAWCYKSGMISAQAQSAEAKQNVKRFLEEWRQGKVIWKN